MLYSDIRVFLQYNILHKAQDCYYIQEDTGSLKRQASALYWGVLEEQPAVITLSTFSGAKLVCYNVESIQ